MPTTCSRKEGCWGFLSPAFTIQFLDNKRRLGWFNSDNPLHINQSSLADLVNQFISFIKMFAFTLWRLLEIIWILITGLFLSPSFPTSVSLPHNMQTYILQGSLMYFTCLPVLVNSFLLSPLLYLFWFYCGFGHQGDMAVH